MPTTYDVEDVDELFVLVGAVGYKTNGLLPENNPSIHSHLKSSFSPTPTLLQILVFFMQAGFAMIEVGSIQVLNLVEATENILFEVLDLSSPRLFPHLLPGHCSLTFADTN
jgi:hypothetical protein